MAGWGPAFQQAAGEMYDWAILIMDAERAHVAPWDLAGVPQTAGMPYWQEWIRAVHSALDAVQAHHDRQRARGPARFGGQHHA